MVSSNFFNVDLKQQVRWNTPRRRRTPVLLALLYALAYSVTQTLNSLLIFRDAKKYQLMITPQVCYLERMLNDRFDFTLRRIVIDDADWHLPNFIYQEGENHPVYMSQEVENAPVYMFTEGEAGAIHDDFVVLVPISIIFSDPEMKSLLDQYKLAGTKYTIQRI
jgi:hypothetical protein